MEKKELYDGFLVLEKHAQQMLKEIAAMKDDMAETLERNAELEIENKHLRQHLAELEKDDNKTSDGGVELSKSKQNLESLYNEVSMFAQCFMASAGSMTSHVRFVLILFMGRIDLEQQRSFGTHTTGTLYLVPTPIGNLADMTIRAVELLKTVDLIAAEDTRHTQMLLNHFEIATKTISFHEHNTQMRIPELLAKLQNGVTIAQVSDAGMPSISDPGKELVHAAIEAGIPVVPLPGANAATTALIASGLPPQPFLFYGFLPRKTGEKQRVLKKLSNEPATLLFYESPHRVGKTLAAMVAVFGDRQAVLARELTKKFETFIRGSLTELQTYAANELKGEFVIMVAGATDKPAVNSQLPLKAQVAAIVATGAKPNAAIKLVAKQNGVAKQVVYDAYHELDK